LKKNLRHLNEKYKELKKERNRQKEAEQKKTRKN
jgi:hypothetical protein